LLSVKWDNGDIEKTAETVSAFLGVPSATPQVIIDKAKECFSALKGEPGIMTVDFERVELRCGVGPDIQWGRVVVVRVKFGEGLKAVLVPHNEAGRLPKTEAQLGYKRLIPL
jgi:hypothetical protein